MFSMNRLSLQDRAKILGMLVEGNSMRATSRMADVSINTVTKLLVDVGSACADYQNATLRNLPCKRLQLDEIWSFCYAKQRNVPDDKKRLLGYGDVWTWTAICADTKLVPSWFVGGRDAFYAQVFAKDVASRLSTRVQVTSDGYHAYIDAIQGAFGADVDYAMLVKTYGQSEEGERPYSPAVCTGAFKRRIIGDPKVDDVSTSYAERQNLTMRMSMRRFTRLTNGFSKKIENLEHAVALHFMHYNFGRVHKTLRVTPAMEARVSDHIWSLEEIASLAA
jgi:IS1 family transposase